RNLPAPIRDIELSLIATCSHQPCPPGQKQDDATASPSRERHCVPWMITPSAGLLPLPITLHFTLVLLAHHVEPLFHQVGQLVLLPQFAALELLAYLVHDHHLVPEHPAPGPFGEEVGARLQTSHLVRVEPPVAIDLAEMERFIAV